MFLLEIPFLTRQSYKRNARNLHLRTIGVLEWCDLSCRADDCGSGSVSV